MKNFRKDYPDFSNFFNFEEFNEVQLRCFKPLMKDRRNIVVSSPTSSGKTVIFELAIINQLKDRKPKCLYLAPIKSLCHEKSSSWRTKFQNKINIFQLTSDTSQQEQNASQLDQMNLVIATPEKIDSFSRKSLTFLSKIDLLLVDEVHMLNFQERGATLEAVVSRIMSINNPRIIAVSATIPNLKEVAQWLRVPNQMTFLFGEECRPVKIHKVVLGFKSSNNPFTFEKLLNYKLTQVIRTYSEGKGALVFCQTQKGTQMACQQVISDMREREFIDSDQTLMSLIQSSKRVANSSLQIMIPQGVAFHNAGLSLQDRSIVEKLFLQNKIRILCTTSTLAMGINLPARLVVIKSTQCYRGAGKGYQEYTQIQMDQMTGRAGRPPFDTEGTVVIMTEKQNYNKYLNSGKLQILQSHLYGQLTEHINAEICLKSIKNFNDVIKYFMNSFCYIRMKNSPASYNIKGNLQVHVQKICLDSITKLSTYNLIKYYPENQNIVPRQLGINVGRNSIEIDTIINVIRQISKIKSQRDYLTLLCTSQQVKKYRNKLDERKLLKQINEKNKYSLKGAISNPEKKCYVLLQCELDGRHIENWELRKQAKDMMYFMRRLTYCVKTACQDMRLFWPFYWSCSFNKAFSLKFWDRNEQMAIRQFPQLNEKWKTLSVKGFKNIEHVMNNLQHLDTICQKNNQFSQTIARKVNNLKQNFIIKLSSCNDQNKMSDKSSIKQQNINSKGSQLFNNFSQSEQIQMIQQKQGYNISKDILITVKFSGFFDENLKSILIVVGQGYELYTVRLLKQQCKQTTIAISSSRKYNIGIIKNNYIGFDQFYQIFHGKDIKATQNVAEYIDIESDDKLNKAQKQNKNNQQKDKLKNSSDRHQNPRKSIQKPISLNKNPQIQAKNKKSNGKKRSKSNQWIVVNKTEQSFNDSSTIQNKNKVMKTINYKNKNTEKRSRKKLPQELNSSQDQFTKLNAIPGSFIPLNQYKCWKSGFRSFQDEEQSNQYERTVNKQKLLIVDDASSKSKPHLQNQIATVKPRQQSIQWDKYAYNFKKPISFAEEVTKEQNSFESKPEIKNERQSANTNPYDYFLNLFNK